MGRRPWLSATVAAAAVILACGRDPSPRSSLDGSATPDQAVAGTSVATASPTGTTLVAPTQSETPIVAPVVPPAPANPVATAEPPVAVHPRGTRTGITAVDQAIDAVERDDRAALAALVRFHEVACEAPGNVQPQPLVCREGMEPGDLLRGFLATHVEGALWIMPAEGVADWILTNMIALDAGIYAVYDCRNRCAEYPPYLTPEYLVVFAAWSAQSGPWYNNLAVLGSKVVAVHFAFPAVPWEAWNDPADPGWVLPPAQ
jgi:hypothetical protein